MNTKQYYNILRKDTFSGCHFLVIYYYFIINTIIIIRDRDLMHLKYLKHAQKIISKHAFIFY